MTATASGTRLWESLGKRRSTAFLVGGLLLAVDAAWLAMNMSTGAEGYLLPGQLFVGVGWTIALVGLLGLYPALSEQSRWLSRVGAVCAGIGVVTFAVMAVVVFVDITGLVAGVYEPMGAFFIPGVIVGSVLGFVAFSVAVFRTHADSVAFGLLLLAPPVLVLSNILRFVAGYTSEMVTLGIVIADALSLLVVGYYLRNQSPLGYPESAAQSAA
ncbi:hypothetical protein [Halorarius halobius]|uniref:hypothetical protein n=1 Tax=Halorarius halobius TaxID=2962671 RepID=UPI0020CE918B|nr:hypothetical protein [Halorarius halobius]